MIIVIINSPNWAVVLMWAKKQTNKITFVSYIKASKIHLYEMGYCYPRVIPTERCEDLMRGL